MAATLVVFLGAPGSGKGTQAKKLAKECNVLHLSTGDLLRKAISEETSLGKKAKEFMDRGELVPDDLMIDLLKTTLEGQNSSTIILDGFPRTEVQARALDISNLKVNLAVSFDLTEQELVARLTGRRICSKCGESFHLMFLPPKINNICDFCKSPLIQRTDDTLEVVNKRLQVFNEQSSKLIDYYKKQKCLKRLDAKGDIETIQDKLIHLMGLCEHV